jgi:hypothetical protein
VSFDFGWRSAGVPSARFLRDGLERFSAAMDARVILAVLAAEVQSPQRNLASARHQIIFILSEVRR